MRHLTTSVFVIRSTLSPTSSLIGHYSNTHDLFRKETEQPRPLVKHDLKECRSVKGGNLNLLSMDITERDRLRIDSEPLYIAFDEAKTLSENIGDGY